MIFGYYELKRRDKGTDDYGQPLSTFTSCGKVRMFICIKDNNKVDDPRYAEITHTGLAQTGSFELGDKITAKGKDYIVRLINAEHRLTQLFLIEEE